MTLNWIRAVRAERLRVIPIFSLFGSGVFVCLIRHIIFLPPDFCTVRSEGFWRQREDLATLRLKKLAAALFACYYKQNLLNHVKREKRCWMLRNLGKEEI